MNEHFRLITTRLLCKRRVISQQGTTQGCTFPPCDSCKTLASIQATLPVYVWRKVTMPIQIYFNFLLKNRKLIWTQTPEKVHRFQSSTLFCWISQQRTSEITWLLFSSKVPSLFSFNYWKESQWRQLNHLQRHYLRRERKTEEREREKKRRRWKRRRRRWAKLWFGEEIETFLWTTHGVCWEDESSRIHNSLQEINRLMQFALFQCQKPHYKINFHYRWWWISIWVIKMYTEFMSKPPHNFKLHHICHRQTEPTHKHSSVSMSNH